MTVCNMAIEAGARAGMIAVDATTIEYLKGRPFAPQGELWERAVAHWRTLVSDPDAKFDRTVTLDAATIAPQVTWGTSPEMVTSIEGRVPDPDKEKDSILREGLERALTYMGLAPNTAMTDIRIDKVFIGSCTNSRIEDLRAAAAIVRGRRKADSVKLALVVPGSGPVKLQAEREGLDRIFTAAGFEWREPGCSMCLGMNDDRLGPGERCASTSNRNFEGRQGTGRAHASREPDHGRRGGASPAISSTCARRADSGVTMRRRTVPHAHRSRRAARPRQRRHRRDHPQAVPEVDQAHGLRPESVRRVALPRPRRARCRTIRGGRSNPQFVLNEPRYQGAQILLARRNFGCGSSREHAPWALLDYGFRVLIAPSFADIFFENCCKNGLLPVVLSAHEVDRLFHETAALPGFRLTVSLDAQTVATTDGATVFGFEIDPFRKHCLQNGLDEIGLTLGHADVIRAFEAKHLAQYPWLA